MTEKNRKKTEFGRVKVFEDLTTVEKEPIHIDNGAHAEIKQSDAFLKEITIDQATIKALKSKHGLVEEKIKTAFSWKKSLHKQLKNLSTDTEVSVDSYLAKWAEEGLKRERKRIYGSEE